MALTKKIIMNRSFKGEYQHCEIETVTVILEDGKELSKSSHRETCICGDDVRATALGIDMLTNVVWTQQIRDDWDAYIEALRLTELERVNV